MASISFEVFAFPQICLSPGPGSESSPRASRAYLGNNRLLCKRATNSRVIWISRTQWGTSHLFGDSFAKKPCRYHYCWYLSKPDQSSESPEQQRIFSARQFLMNHLNMTNSMSHDVSLRQGRGKSLQWYATSEKLPITRDVGRDANHLRRHSQHAAGDTHTWNKH